MEGPCGQHSDRDDRPSSQGTTAGNIIGTPSIPGTYQFTLQVTDQVGNTDQETLTVDVV